MLSLSSGPDWAEVDELHGAAIIDALLAGVRPLAAACHANPVPVAVAERDSTWVAGWQGGWQPNFPNAGQATTGDYPQGFHGNASQTAWDVIARTDSAVRLEWADDRLVAIRTIRLFPGRIEVAMEVSNHWTEPCRFVTSEHLVLGRALLSGAGTITPGDGTTIHRLTRDGDPLDTARWPGDKQERWALVDRSTPARVAALDVPNQTVRFDSPAGSAEVSWSGLPYLMLWEEIGATAGGPFFGKALALGLEPTSTPHGGGLDLATRRDDGITLAAGESTGWQVVLICRQPRS